MFQKVSAQKSLFWLIAISTVIRCALALTLDLGNDEVYYFTYATQPDWNHFDHPPLSGMLIRIFTLNLTWINALSMRLPAIAGAAVSTWLISKCGHLIRNEKTGMIAALFYNISIYTSIISGLFILPDSIQIAFWLAAVLTMLKIVRNDSDNILFKLIILGVWIGLAMMCKVHGIFLWIGFFGYILLNNRKLLLTPSLYISVIITGLVFSPVIFWNIKNDFITWQFHSARVLPAATGLDISSFLRTLLGQVAYNNPCLVTIQMITVVAILSGESGVQRKYVNLLLWCALPIIIATTTAALVRPALPHWSGPGFIGLILLSASYADKKMTSGSRLISGLIKTSFALTIFAVTGGYIFVKFYPGTIGTKDGTQLGHNDVTLDLTGWKLLLPEFEKIRDHDIQAGSMKPDSPLIVNKWFPGGHLYFYVAYPLQIPIVGAGNLNDLHKFAWLNRQHGYLSPGANAYFISASNYFADPVSLFARDFRRISLAATIPQIRNGKTARNWYIYRLENATTEIGFRLNE